MSFFYFIFLPFSLLLTFSLGIMVWRGFQGGNVLRELVYGGISGVAKELTGPRYSPFTAEIYARRDRERKEGKKQD